MKNVIKALWSFFRESPKKQKTKEQDQNQRKNCIRIGHRGAAGYCPENTFASFRKAIALGADYLEIDVQLTKDGELAVIHDPTVNRTTDGKGKVQDFTLEQLQSLDAGSWFAPQFAGERIPSLKEFLDEFSGRAGILIELKNPSLYLKIEEKLAMELKGRDLADVIVQSFDWNSIQLFHTIMPEVATGILVKNKHLGFSRKELSELSSYTSYINPKKTMVTKRLIKKLHYYGFKTFIWTLRNTREAERLNKLSPDGIISDFPDMI